MKKVVRALGAVFLTFMAMVAVVPTVEVQAKTKIVKKVKEIGCTKYSYDEIYAFSNGAAVVERNSKYGLINIKGKEIVECTYDDIFGPMDEYYLVKKNDTFGVVDHNGKTIISCKYSYIEWYENEKIFIGEDSQRNYYLLDKNGKTVASYTYERMGEFNEGLALVMEYDNYNQRYGYIDKTGKEVIPCKYTYGNNFSEGVAIVKTQEGNCCMIDKTGKVVTDMGDKLGKYEENIVFHNGLAFVRDKNTRKCGVIDKNGVEVIPCKYKYAEEFDNNGYAIVGDELDKKGIINKKGEEIIPCVYSHVEIINENLFLVRTGEWNGEGCIVDGSGNVNIACYFVEAWGDNLYEFFAKYSDDGVLDKAGLIDKNGNVVVKGEYTFIGSLQNGKAEIWKDYKIYGTIDKKGKITRNANAFVPREDGLNSTVEIVKGKIKHGVMNNKKKIILKCEYDSIQIIDGIIIAQKGGKMHFFTSGK